MKSFPIVNPDANVKLSIVDIIIEAIDTIKTPAIKGFSARLSTSSRYGCLASGNIAAA